MKLSSLKSAEGFPRFFVVHSTTDEPVANLSAFFIAKTIKNFVGNNFKAKKQRTGDLFVEIETKDQGTKLLFMKKIGEMDVEVTPHRTLNYTKGVISEQELLQSTDAEIEEELSEQGVIAARRITMRRNNEEIKTKHIVLTFNSTNLPDSIHAAYLHCKVRPYIPNPRRCFKCQRFGHGSMSCRGKPTCVTCGEDQHGEERCERTPKCINCTGQHGAYSRSCPIWKREKEIISIKTKENISYPEARKRFTFQEKGTFADAVRRGPQPRSVSVGTQVALQDLAPTSRSHTHTKAPVAQSTGLKISREDHVISVGGPPLLPSAEASSATGPQISVAELDLSSRPTNQGNATAGDSGAGPSAVASSKKSHAKASGLRGVEPSSKSSVEDMEVTVSPPASLLPKDRRPSSGRGSSSKVKRITSPGEDTT